MPRELPDPRNRGEIKTPSWHWRLVDISHRYAPSVYRRVAICIALMAFTVSAQFASGATISGFKFNDNNKNGVYDLGEPGIPGWFIYIDINNNGKYDSGETYAITKDNGNYSFSNLNAGTYIIREYDVRGWTRTYPASGYYTLTIGQNDVIYNINFGNYDDWPQCNFQCTTQSTYVVNAYLADSNGNSLSSCTPGSYLDVYIWGVVRNNANSDRYQLIIIFDLYVNDLPISYNLTNCFSDTILGKSNVIYRLFGPIEIQCGDKLTLKNVTIQWKTSKVRCVENSQSNCNCPASCPPSGQCDFTQEVYVHPQPPGSISGYKWNDLDGDGSWDPNEPPLSDWNIKLSNTTSSFTNTTDDNGFYIFPDLSAGSYTVCETQNLGWTQTHPTSGCYNVYLEAYQSIDNLNFGNLYGTPSINITKEGYLVEDLEDLCYVAIEYNITVKNTGDVPLEDVYVVDDLLLQNFSIGHMDTGESKTIIPWPRYYITRDDIISGSVNNTATAFGTFMDRTVNDTDTFSFNINIESFEDILRSRSDSIHDFGIKTYTMNDMQKLEHYLRCEDELMLLFADILLEKWPEYNIERRTKLLASYEDLLRRQAENIAIFRNTLHQIWSDLDSDQQRTFSSSLEDLLKRLLDHYKRFEFFEKDIKDHITTTQNTTYLESFEDLLRRLYPTIDFSRLLGTCDWIDDGSWEEVHNK